ncbi:MAG: HAD-IA family hydrolase [Thermodesulfobacteriota bacterium]
MEYPARLLVFDLDGTLVDSKEDLSVAVNVAIGSFGIPPLPHEEICGYIGDGATTLIRKALPADKVGLLPDTLERFLSYYGRHLLDTTRPYPGVAESLREWSGKYRMAVLTNKPLAMSEKILSGLSLSRHFYTVRGADSFPTKKPDPQGLLRLIEEARVSARETVMVGDAKNDVLAGKAAGAVTCGVTYGLGASAFAEHPPDFTVDRFQELFARIRPAG